MATCKLFLNVIGFYSEMFLPQPGFEPGTAHSEWFWAIALDHSATVPANKTTKKHRSTATMKEYPQVRKTGVNAVHEKLPAEDLYHEEM